MRKLGFAIAGGMLLLGAAPAHADTTRPVQDPLNRVLQRTNDWRVATPLAADPLSGQPLSGITQAGRPPVRLTPGDNRAKLGDLAPGQATEGTDLPPAADVLNGTLPSRADRRDQILDRLQMRHLPDTARRLRIGNRPFGSLITDRILFGLLPDGQSVFGDRGRLESADSGIPLLGGLDALTGEPTPDQPAPGDPATGSSATGQPDASGLPIGGTPFTTGTRPGTPLGYPSPAVGSPATGSPAVSSPAASSPTVSSPAAGSPAAGSPTAVDPATSPAGSPAGVGPAGVGSASPAAVDPAFPASVGTATSAPVLVDPAPSAQTPAAPGYTRPSTAARPSTTIEDPRLHEEPSNGAR